MINSQTIVLLDHLLNVIYGFLVNQWFRGTGKDDLSKFLNHNAN